MMVHIRVNTGNRDSIESDLHMPVAYKRADTELQKVASNRKGVGIGIRKWTAACAYDRAWLGVPKVSVQRLIEQESKGSRIRVVRTSGGD